MGSNMKFKNILKRLNGISTPVFGVSWNPIKSEKDQAKEIIAFLEDRRVLYNPSEMEIPGHCIQSIIEIRQFITPKIGTVQSTELQESLRAMRASCRKFLNLVGADEDIVKYGHNLGHWANWEFNSAIGELRGVFGIHLARVAVMYGIDVEEDLAKILPAIDEK
jgi:hypothetical protein